ncbi:MAG: hypothetical protein WBV80_22095 [Mycobacterium sp.]
MLFEVGEENAAVLLSRSDLPDQIDLQRDIGSLVAFGLDRDQVDEVAQLTKSAVESAGRQRDETEKTISGRWADLVEQWLR